MELMTDLREAIIIIGQIPCFVDIQTTAPNSIISIWPRIQVIQFTLSS